MQDFTKLKVWKVSHQLTLDLYKATQAFPREEQYGLTAQMRRSCMSIPTNIAEGAGRESNAEFKRFLYIAMGSSSELQYQLLLARDLNYLNQDTYDHLSEKLDHVRRMLNSLLRSVAG